MNKDLPITQGLSRTVFFLAPVAHLGKSELPLDRPIENHKPHQAWDKYKPMLNLETPTSSKRTATITHDVAMICRWLVEDNANNSSTDQKTKHLAQILHVYA